jgi:predicted GNAT superfamily acetyltransferase
VRAADAANAPVVNPTRPAGEWQAAETVRLDLDERRLWVEVPGAFTRMQQEAPDLARQWRMETRAIFQRYFANGYRAVDFEFHREEQRGRYLLARS